jgi:hypothetical protein
MPITPDTKDWTWVLTRPCPECSFDVSKLQRDDIAELIRANAGMWQELLAHPQASVRPSDDVWSALEYGCHVRDVFDLYLFRLQLMLDEDDPLFPNWDQDATALESNYEAQDPAIVAVELQAAAGRLAGAFDGVAGAQWERRGRRSDGASFTIESFARYLVHDPVHHVHDAREGLAKLVEG